MLDCRHDNADNEPNVDAELFQCFALTPGQATKLVSRPDYADEPDDD